VNTEARAVLAQVSARPLRWYCGGAAAPVLRQDVGKQNTRQVQQVGALSQRPWPMPPAS
jgi:hypothetical protein